MEITKKIKIRIDKRGDLMICRDGESLKMALGTVAAQSNLHLYNVKKEKGNFLVPITTIKKRIEMMKDRIDVMNERIDVMEQIVGTHGGKYKSIKKC